VLSLRGSGPIDNSSRNPEQRAARRGPSSGKQFHGASTLRCGLWVPCPLQQMKIGGHCDTLFTTRHIVSRRFTINGGQRRSRGLRASIHRLPRRFGMKTLRNGWRIVLPFVPNARDFQNESEKGKNTMTTRWKNFGGRCTRPVPDSFLHGWLWRDALPFRPLKSFGLRATRPVNCWALSLCLMLLA